MVQHIVFGGTEEELAMAVKSTNHMLSGLILFATLLQRFIRKGMNCRKDIKMHSRATDFLHELYNFVKPHKSLWIEVNQGNRKRMKSTPAIVEGLADHIWTLEEVANIWKAIQ